MWQEETGLPIEEVADAGPAVEPTYEAWSGVPTMPRVNLAHPPARAYMLQALTGWVRDYGDYGWRLDVARYVDPAVWRDLRRVLREVRPWQATLRRNPPVPIFFRDVRLSDLIGFEYSGMTGGAAAADFMRRLRAIRDRLDAEGLLGGALPPVVPVILDGENAWEHYANDGKDFLRALYRRLGEADWVATITPSEYLQRFAEPEPLDEVFPASWFQPNFATWFGEEEEALAWDYLWRVRDDLRRAERSGEVEDEALASAYERMLFAEGSDWFWWYGSDQESGDDGYFDRAFRELLGHVYDRLCRKTARSCRCRPSRRRRSRWCASRMRRRR